MVGENNRKMNGQKLLENLIMVPKENSSKLCIPWLKLGAVLLVVWFSFFSIYLLRRDGSGQVKFLSFFYNLHGPNTYTTCY
jgi:Flp pilus assembly protein protease CpaA